MSTRALRSRFKEIDKIDSRKFNDTKTYYSKITKALSLIDSTVQLA